MKKLIVIFVFLAVTFSGYSQYGGVTPTDGGRVLADTTKFKVGIPVGKTIYCISNDTYYYCKISTDKTESLSTKPENFVAVAKADHAHSQYLLASAARYQIVEQYAETTEGTQGRVYSCSAKPLPGTLKVTMNNKALNSAQYALVLNTWPTQSTIQVKIPVYKYDQIVLDYSYVVESNVPDGTTKTPASEAGLNN